MPRYQRAKIAGGTFFFTVAIADRSDDLLVREIDRLRAVYRLVQSRHPFETIAICVLPDHLHALWTLPDNDSDFPLRWSLNKRGFSHGLAAARLRSTRHVVKREKGLWQRRYWEHAIRDEKDLSRSRLHPLQSGEARTGPACRRLAAQQLSPLRRTRAVARRLGRRCAGDCRFVWRIGTMFALRGGHGAHDPYHVIDRRRRRARPTR